MIPKKDHYVDKHGKLTDDPSRYAAQIAVAGHHLDDRTAKRYGITDSLVSVDEPGAVRMVRVKVKPEKIEESEPEASSENAAEAAPQSEAASPEQHKTEATKIAGNKGAKKK